MPGESQVDEAKGDGGSAPATSEELTWFKSEIDQLNSDAESGLWERRKTNDDTRFCRWDGQDPDGRKHQENLSGKKPHPFEGGCDGRIRMADFVTNVKSAILVAAGIRAHRKVIGMEITDEPKAGKIRTLLSWITSNQLGRDWWRELNKLAQYTVGDTPAVGILGIWWDQNPGLRAKQVAPEDLVNWLVEAYGDQVTPELAAEVLEMVLNPAAEDQTAEFLVGLVPTMELSRAKTILRAWREGAAAEFPEPYIRTNRPKVQALRLLYDIFIPTNTGALREARVIFHREWIGKVEARRRMLPPYRYSKAFVDALVGDGAKATGAEGKTGFPQAMTVRKVDGTTEKVELLQETEYKGLYEVATAYWQAVREDGIPGIYRMAFSKFVKEPAYDKTLQEYDHGEYPYIEFAREIVSGRLMDSRGAPELLVTDQSFTKLLDDTFGDHAQMTFPSIFVPERRPDSKLEVGPMAQIKRRRPGDYEWMKLPDYPATTEKQREEIRRRVHEYWGIPHEAVSPVIADLLNQQAVDGFLWGLADAFQMMIQLCQQYMTDGQIARIVGGKGVALGRGLAEIQGKFDLTLAFDVRTLDPDYVIKLAEALSKYILVWDTSQTIMRDRLTAIVMGAINPNLAEETIRPVEEADQAEVDEEETNFAKIAAGIEPPMQEQGQNWGVRLQTLEMIGQRNPEAVQKLTPMSLEILKKRMEHFEFQIQQQENALIGKVGARPALDEAAEKTGEE